MRMTRSMPGIQMKTTTPLHPSPPSDTITVSIEAAADAWSSGSNEDSHQLEVPTVSPSLITIHREYSAVDFDFVDSSWLPNPLAGDGDSSPDENDDDFI